MDTPAQPSRAATVALWTARVVAAAILGQTLFFKFSAAPESVYIFEKVGLGTPGRIGSAVAELVAVVLLLWPGRTTAALGSALSLGVIGGAIMSHLTVLGIEVMDDGGTLFVLALVVAAAAGYVLLQTRRALPWIGQRIP